MKRLVILALFVLCSFAVKAQPNCNVYLWSGDTCQYQACNLSEDFNNYYQFDMRGLDILDSCIAICPRYCYALYEKAVVYLKAGNFVGWAKYMNQAVYHEPLNYLGLRASCNGKFFADYEGAIADIDKLHTLTNQNIGFTHNGTYHLDAYRALCFKMLRDYPKAIALFEQHINTNSDGLGLFDYLHLGVCYQSLGDHQQAINHLSHQLDQVNIAETHFYLAKSYLALQIKSSFEHHLLQAKLLLTSGQKMYDGYHPMEDEIFKSDLDKLIWSKK